jgi:hypothetical protein
MMFRGEFQPVLAKHSKNFSLANALSIGIDQMQRNFEPMKRQIESWRESQLADLEARMVIYQAFIEGELSVPQYLARTVHDRYFNPLHEDFAPRTVWSLSTVERLHFGVQGAGADSALPRNGEVGSSCRGFHKFEGNIIYRRSTCRRVLL